MRFSTGLILIAIFVGGCTGCQITPAFPTRADIAAASDEALKSEWQRFHQPFTNLKTDAYPSAARYIDALREDAILRFGWPPDVAERVRDEKVWTNQTKEQLWWSWGPPKKVDVDHRPGRVEETWYYGERAEWSGFGKDAWYYTRVFIENGHVNSWVIERRNVRP